jgi:Concanavalin A-like lectin/glucanases superfamily/Putative Ig domain/Bacterial Ig-like domain
VTWSGSGLPDGLTITSGGLISGSPTAACTCAVTVRATDGFGLVGSAAFTWTIAPLPVLTNPGAQSSQLGTTVSLALAVTGGTAPFAWAVTTPGPWGATGLPPGLSLNTATGVISGSPTTIGAADVTVSVTDALGKSASATFTWAVVNTTYNGLVLADGARGYWRLGESSGTTAVDETGASNGTYAGGVTLGDPGALVNDPNTAVDLNGASGRVSIPSVSALNLTSRVSIEAWVRPESLAGTRWIVNKGTAYFLYISDGITFFGVNAGGQVLFITTTQVTAGTWQHLVGTYDGTRLVLYRNGAAVASAAASGAIASTTAPVFIGAVDATAGFFDGGVDEVAIYGGALSAAQVDAHYDRGNGTRPDLAITFPDPGEIYGTSSWNAGCSSAICGTAGDTGGGVASVAVSIRQGTGSYWNGTAFASATEVLLPATGTTSWTRSFAGASFPADGPYTVRAVAADAVGTTASASITFTINKTAPTVALAFPASGGTYNNTTWNAGCSSAICGTATAATGGVASVAVSIRQSGGSYWNGTAFASATEVLLPATGTTSWTRSFAGASFPADGAYTVRAVATDTAGNTASTSRSFTIDRIGPAPTGLTLFNADGVVTPRTDEVRITFSDAISTSSICSAWSGTGDQTLGGNGVVVTITNNGGNDLLTVTSGSCTLHIGSIATGNDYVSSTATFSGSGNNQSKVAWKASTRTLTIAIGRQTGGTLNSGLAAATVVYTPDAAIKDVAGNAITTTPFSSAGQRF